MKVDIFMDTVCPWCLIGKQNLMTAISQWQKEDVEIDYRSFLLDPTVPKEGKSFQAKMQQIAGNQVDQMLDRVCKIGEDCGVNFNFDKVEYMPNTVLSHQLLHLTPQSEKTQMMDAITRAYFEEGRNIGDIDVLVEIAGENGFEKETIRTQLINDEAKDLFERDIAFAKEIGVSGVPLFLINDKYTISGAQPPESFIQAFDQIKKQEV